jgi:nucleotide-binding universal stress UspA family protein
MNRTTRNEIVVGVDGSPASDAAVGYALMLGRSLPAPVRLVHAVPMYSPVGVMPVLTGEVFADTGRELLAGVERRARLAAPDVEVLTSRPIGPSGSCLVEAAEDAQLVVLGRGIRLDRIVSGSTAAHVTIHASCPVRIVPEDWTPEEAGGPVVVGLKDIETSVDLLRRGFAVASQAGRPLVVLHAWHLPPGYEQIVTAPDLDAWNAHAAARIEHALKAIRTVFPDVAVEVRVVQAKATDGLVEASAGAGLVLVGRRSHRRPFDRLGSIARTLQRTGRCPVEAGPASHAPEPELDLVLESEGALLR